MDNNDLFILFPDLRHGWFDAKIKKPMEHINMNALNTIVVNDMENSKLGEAGFDEHDIFSPPSIEEKIYFDDTLPPIYDDYNDSSLLLPPVMEDKFDYDYNIPPIFDSYFVEFAPTTINKNDYAYLGVVIILCMRLMIRMLYVIVILLSLLMLLLKVIMREENMVVEIFMLLKCLSMC